MENEIIIDDHSDEVLDGIDLAKRKSLIAIGLTAERYAKKETPVDTGRLRNSITNVQGKDAVYIGTNVEYGPYIELGTTKMKGHHMLKRAATEHKKEYQEIVKAAFGADE